MYMFGQSSIYRICLVCLKFTYICGSPKIYHETNITNQLCLPSPGGFPPIIRHHKREVNLLAAVRSCLALFLYIFQTKKYFSCSCWDWISDCRNHYFFCSSVFEVEKIYEISASHKRKTWIVDVSIGCTWT